MHVARAVERVIAAAVRHLNQLLLDARALLQFHRIHKVRRAKLLPPLLLRIVHIHHDDLACAILLRALNDTQPHAARAKHSHVAALLDAALAGRDDRRAVARGDAAAEQAGAVHGRLVGDGDNADVGDDGVLREGRRPHEVQQLLALAGEARGAVGHHAFALGRADLAAEVRLAGFAELAFAALGCAIIVVH